MIKIRNFLSRFDEPNIAHLGGIKRSSINKRIQNRAENQFNEFGTENNRGEGCMVRQKNMIWGNNNHECERFSSMNSSFFGLQNSIVSYLRKPDGPLEAKRHTGQIVSLSLFSAKLHEESPWLLFHIELHVKMERMDIHNSQEVDLQRCD